MLIQMKDTGISYMGFLRKDWATRIGSPGAKGWETNNVWAHRCII